MSDTIVGAIIALAGSFGGFALSQWSQSCAVRAADRRALRDARRERLRGLYQAIMEGLVERRAALDLLAPDNDFVSIERRRQVRSEAFDRLVKSSFKAGAALSLEKASADVVAEYRQMNDKFVEFIRLLSDVSDEEMVRRRAEIATQKEQIRQQIDLVQDRMADHLEDLERPV